MAIETQPESAQAPGGREPGGTPKQRSWWLRPAWHTALIGAVIGYAIGHWLGNFMTPSFVATGGGAPDGNDTAIVLGYAFLVLGWLIGLGVFNDLVRQMLGRPIPQLEEERAAAGGLSRYFRYTLDHKVVGIQYLVGMLVYFFTGGLLAMAIRTELLSPTYHVLSPDRLPRGGRRARHHDDDDDDLGHRRAVRQLPGADHDRLEAGRVPAARGAVLLAHPVRLRDPAVQLPARRLPDRLDRLRAAVDPGGRGHGLVRVRVRPDGHLDHPGRVQHHRHDHLLPGARHALEPGCRCSSGRC